MKSKRVYTDYLRDMIEYAGKAVQFIQGVTFSDFPGRGTPKADQAELGGAGV
jgi:uncharacterized protein with HEPN domain